MVGIEELWFLFAIGIVGGIVAGIISITELIRNRDKELNY